MHATLTHSLHITLPFDTYQAELQAELRKLRGQLVETREAEANRRAEIRDLQTQLRTAVSAKMT